MAWMNTWPPVKCERFEGEPEDAYRLRTEQVVGIVTGFRMGRFGREIAEEMDLLLTQLTDPAGGRGARLSR